MVFRNSCKGTVDVNSNVATCARTTTVTTANIGLPRVGEMFTSSISRATTRRIFWTLTPNEKSGFYYVSGASDLSSYAPTAGFGARPSMYLKSNVVIAKDNTGDGTYEKPYDIELGQS